MPWKKIAIFSVVVFSFFLIEYFSYNPPSIAVTLNGNLSEVQKKAIDILVDLTKLFITFSYGIIGALAYFLKEGPKTRLVRSWYEAVLVGTTTIMAIGCIYFGNTVLTALFDMLSNDILALTSPAIDKPARYQYICLLISALCLVAYTVERHPIEIQSKQ